MFFYGFCTQCHVLARTHLTNHNFPRAQIHDGGDIQPTFLDGDISHMLAVI